MALKLSADPSSFESGMLDAIKSANKFRDNVGNVAANVGTAFDKLAANPVGVAIMAAAKAFEIFKSVSSGVAAELSALNAEGVKAGNAQHALERKFGMSAEAAGGFSLAIQSFGLDAERTSMAGMELSRKINDAVAGFGGSGEALKRLNLDGKELMKLPLDQQIAQVGDAISKLPSAGERASAGMALMGEKFRDLEPLMKLGDKGMDAMTAKSLRWGLTLSTADSAAIRSATLAQKNADLAASSVRQSFANGIAGAFAPLQQAWAEIQSGAVEFLQGPLGVLRDGIGGVSSFIKDIIAGVRVGFGEWLGPLSEAKARLEEAWGQLSASLNLSGDWQDTLRGIAREVGRIAGQWLTGVVNITTRIVEGHTRWINVISATGTALKSSVVYWLDRIMSGFQRMLEAAGMLPDKLGGAKFRAAAQQLDAMKNAAVGYVDQLNVPLPSFDLGGGAGGMAAMTEAQRTLRDALTQTNTSLQEQIATFGMSSAEKEIYKLQTMGATQADLDATAALQDTLDMMQSLAKIEGPWDKWTKDVAKFDRWLADDQISVEQHAKLLADADKTAFGQAAKSGADSLAKKDDKGPQALARGSSEAISAINAFKLGGDGGGPQEKILAEQKAGNKIAADQLRAMRDVADKVRGNIAVAEF